jgi:pimeloyl-ACP methyl ester carboxylesterase
MRKQAALPFLRKKILREHHFDIKNVDIINNVAYCNLPVLFIHGKRDQLVPQSQTITLFSNYGERVAESAPHFEKR